MSAEKDTAIADLKKALAEACARIEKLEKAGKADKAGGASKESEDKKEEEKVAGAGVDKTGLALTLFLGVFQSNSIVERDSHAFRKWDKVNINRNLNTVVNFSADKTKITCKKDGFFRIHGFSTMSRSTPGVVATTLIKDHNYLCIGSAYSAGGDCQCVFDTVVSLGVGDTLEIEETLDAGVTHSDVYEKSVLTIEYLGNGDGHAGKVAAWNSKNVKSGYRQWDVQLTNGSLSGWLILDADKSKITVQASGLYHVSGFTTGSRSGKGTIGNTVLKTNTDGSTQLATAKSYTNDSTASVAFDVCVPLADQDNLQVQVQTDGVRQDGTAERNFLMIEYLGPLGV